MSELKVKPWKKTKDGNYIALIGNSRLRLAKMDGKKEVWELECSDPRMGFVSALGPLTEMHLKEALISFRDRLLWERGYFYSTLKALQPYLPEEEGEEEEGNKWKQTGQDMYSLQVSTESCLLLEKAEEVWLISCDYPQTCGVIKEGKDLTETKERALIKSLQIYLEVIMQQEERIKELENLISEKLSAKAQDS